MRAPAMELWVQVTLVLLDNGPIWKRLNLSKLNQV